MKPLQRLLMSAAVFILSVPAVAQSSADARYCDKLISLYRTYINNPEDPRPAYQSPQAAQETAIANCKAGNPAAGIPVLEKALQDKKLALPARGEG